MVLQPLLIQIMYTVRLIKNMIRRALQMQPKANNHKKEIIKKIEQLIEDSDEDRSYTILESIQTAYSMSADDAMTPKSHMHLSSENTPSKDIIQNLSQCTQNKVILFKGDNSEEITGYALITDIIQNAKADTKLNSLKRDVIFIPPSMKLYELLTKMKTGNTDTAIVVDEYGIPEGVVTLSDIIKKIFLYEQQKHQRSIVHKISENKFEVCADIRIEDLEQEINHQIITDEDKEDAEEDDYDTISGYILHTIGYVPKIGEKIPIHKTNTEIQVVDANSRRIERITITITDNNS